MYGEGTMVIMRILGGGGERLDVGEVPGVGTGEREDVTSRPVLCGKQTGGFTLDLI